MLNRLWSWYDPTMYPYLMKLSVLKQNGLWYGWKELIFEVESQTWDFGLPVMSTYKQILEKISISEKEAKDRSNAKRQMCNYLKKRMGE